MGRVKPLVSEPLIEPMSEQSVSQEMLMQISAVITEEESQTLIDAVNKELSWLMSNPVSGQPISDLNKWTSQNVGKKVTQQVNGPLSVPVSE